MDLIELTKEIEDLIRDEILSNTTYDWREEHIVRCILRRLRNLINDKTIDDSYQIYNLRFNVFQTDKTNNTEEKFGDIAIIMSIEFNDSDIIEGVGFIEAKIRAKKSNRYASIRKKQLSRINKNAPHSLLMLIDYDPINKKIPVFGQERHFHYYGHWPSHSVVTQINTALKIDKSDTSLYKLTYPFSYQLTHRYFYGLDLEFNYKIIQQIKGFAEKKELPDFAVFITIDPKDKKDVSKEVKINREIYKELK